MEQTVILIKPDAVKKGAIGAIISRLERADFTLVAAKLVNLSDMLLDDWYEHHKHKSFFPELRKFMRQTPVMAMLWEGRDVIAKVRALCGPTDSTKAPKGTIRGDFGTDIQANAIHASEHEEAAKREAGLMFSSEEIYNYRK
jgi:nucleoside-diphosphate kinase